MASTNNLSAMPEITDAFLSDILGEIIDEQQTDEKLEQQQQNLSAEYTTNNFAIQNNESNIAMSRRRNKDKLTSNVGSKTMQRWLNGSELMVHPVWIGNLPIQTTNTQLRYFVESYVGKCIVSIHINKNNNSNKNNNTKNTNIKHEEKAYAFINLPSAEKQMLTITLLDNALFNNCKLMVRPNKPLKFQPLSFFNSGNSIQSQQQFQRFRHEIIDMIKNDCINMQSVQQILQLNSIHINDLPNRVYGVQCKLIPNCHRSYCSFYHCDKEQKLGRILAIIAAQNKQNEKINKNINNMSTNNNNIMKSRHTLLVEGLVQNKSEKIDEIFDVFGDVDYVMLGGNNMWYVRMKRSQDAQKIVCLFNNNHTGVRIDFAPYQNQHLRLKQQSISEPYLNGAYQQTGAYYCNTNNGHGLRNAYSQKGCEYNT